MALIEESHFLLSEMHRVSTSASEVAAARPADRGSRSKRQRRVSPVLLVAFVATIGIASVLLEIVDPAPMTIQAGELVFP